MRNRKPFYISTKIEKKGKSIPFSTLEHLKNKIKIGDRST